MATSPPPAPEDIALLIEFTNTVDLEAGEDDLATPEMLLTWLGEHDPKSSAGTIAGAEHKRVLKVREALRDLASANAGGNNAGAAVATLNRAARAAPLTVKFLDAAETELHPERTGADGFIATLLATVHLAVADGSWARVKACGNDECRWLFFDRSRNRSRTWCDMSDCGNLMKARAYRRRKGRKS